MSTYIKAFLETEYTCIPQVFNKYFEKYYSNALSNGMFWMVVLWSFIHLIFDSSLNALLKKMGNKEYVRVRLKYSLWYLGFYGAALWYCGTILVQQGFVIFDVYKLLINLEGRSNGNFVLGHIILVSFMVHSMVWEAVAKNDFMKALSYALLVSFVVLSYLVRSVEVTFTFLLLVSAAHLVTEMMKIVQTVCDNGFVLTRKLKRSAFYCMIIFVVAIDLLALPMTTLVPFAFKLMDGLSLTTVVFIVTLLVCLTEIASSPCRGLFIHYLYHRNKNVDEFTCPSCLVECSLFATRDDDVHKIKLLRKEIKKREDKMYLLRKPKNSKNMLIQTIKCMVAIRRRLNNRKKPEGSEDSESDVSESDTKEMSEITPESEEKEIDEPESEDEAADLDIDKEVETGVENQVEKNEISLTRTEEFVQ